MTILGAMRKLFEPRAPLPANRNSCDVCGENLEGLTARYDSHWDDLTCDSDQCASEAAAARW